LLKSALGVEIHIIIVVVIEVEKKNLPSHLLFEKFDATKSIDSFIGLDWKRAFHSWFVKQVV